MVTAPLAGVIITAALCSQSLGGGLYRVENIAPKASDQP